MIPYDDLVVALATWRAKQGLPVAQLSGALTPPPAAPAPAARVGSGPRSAAPAPAVRAAPPVAPGRPAPSSGRTAMPMPLPSEDSLDVDDAMVDEAQLEPEGDDFAMAFNSLQADDHDESTSIGTAPGPRDSFGGLTDANTLDQSAEELPNPKGSSRTGGNRNDDW